MERLTLDVPALFGDHHVVEVRRILFAMDGVVDVYASSAFHVLEVDFDPGKISADAITEALEEAGYLGELSVPKETGSAATEIEREAACFRHTIAFEQTKQVVGFAQSVPNPGRPLWPCPGMGPIKVMKEE